MRRDTCSRTRPGNVIPVAAIMCVFLVGMVAFAIDTGYVAGTRTRLQSAADAGALAGCEKLVVWPDQAIPEASARAECKKFAQANENLTIRDTDIRLLRYDPMAPAGSRVSSAWSITSPPNACEITMRRDDLANGKLPLFFAPVLGKNSADVRARATAYIMPAKGILPGAPMLPYAVQVDYYFAACGQTRTGVDGKTIDTMDNWTVRPDGSVVSGPDGIKEIVLFSDTNNKPGNFGSLDIGSSQNGTPELDRQILYGPTAEDFQNSDFRDKVAADGALYIPFIAGGDSGMSTSVKSKFEQIAGSSRIVPLYDVVINPGDNAQYHLVTYAVVTITQVDFTGSPKKLWVQPARLSTNRVVASDLVSTPAYGVFTPPRLVIP
ncbi:MAG TPA: pilus assembly protein TadG-related protein [Gemmataceae bacterium]|nr:pilus assembly protein TadG-related protein [Gemmataceae bacterium]